MSLDSSLRMPEPLIEGNDFTNEYERLRSLCRRAKGEIADVLAHLEELPNLEKAFQLIGDARTAKGRGFTNLIAKIDKARDQLSADANALAYFAIQAFDAFAECLGNLSDPELEGQLALSAAELRGQLEDVSKVIERASCELDAIYQEALK